MTIFVIQLTFPHGDERCHTCFYQARWHWNMFSVAIITVRGNAIAFDMKETIGAWCMHGGKDIEAIDIRACKCF